MTGYFGFVLPKNCSVYNLLIEFQKITIITCDPLRIRERRKSQRPLPLRERAAFVALELAELIEAMPKAILVRDGRGCSCPAFLWGGMSDISSMTRTRAARTRLSATSHSAMIGACRQSA